MNKFYVVGFLFLTHFSLIGQCEHPDYNGLMQLYEATDGDNWHDNAGWLEGARGESCDPCKDIWSGVLCKNNRVSSIYLSGFLNLSSGPPGNNLQGELPNMDLKFLESLSIRGNNLNGDFPEFTKMPQLKFLDASNNNFSGQLWDFSNTKHLVRLVLSNNLLEGVLPEFDLEKLEVIDLRHNEIGGHIPADWNLPLLDGLYLDHNKLIGDIPNFPNAPNITEIDISFNELDGNIQKLESLKFLRKLFCNYNKLTGSIPNLQDNSYLTRFEADDNQLTGDPPNVESLNLLRTFSVVNNQLTGCFPEYICESGFSFFDFVGNDEMPFFGSKKDFCNSFLSDVTPYCRKYDDGIVGVFSEADCECVAEICELPERFTYLKDLYNATDGDNWTENYGWKAGVLGRHCDPCDYLGEPWYGITCFDNKIICIDMDGVPDCTNTGFTGNNLNGQLVNIKSADLAYLRFDHNKLTGLMPDFNELPNLSVFHFSFNNFSGPLPSFKSLSRLTEIRGSFNNFSGTIPDYSHLDKLNVLTLSDNNLESCYPDFICDLENFNSSNNVLLPWHGAYQSFCDGEDPVGAPCERNGIAGVINADCECAVTTSSHNLSASDIHIFPNPAKNIITISHITESMSYSIYSSEGQLCLKGEWPGNGTIDISALKHGVYFIKIESSNNLIDLIRFIKSR